MCNKINYTHEKPKNIRIQAFATILLLLTTYGCQIKYGLSGAIISPDIKTVLSIISGTGPE